MQPSFKVSEALSYIDEGYDFITIHFWYLLLPQIFI